MISVVLTARAPGLRAVLLYEDRVKYDNLYLDTITGRRIMEFVHALWYARGWVVLGMVISAVIFVFILYTTAERKTDKSEET